MSRRLSFVFVGTVAELGTELVPAIARRCLFRSASHPAVLVAPSMPADEAIACLSL